MAAEIARAVFENNHEALYKAFTKALLRGNAYCYKELADRGYGRLKEGRHALTGIKPLREASLSRPGANDARVPKLNGSAG